MNGLFGLLDSVRCSHICLVFRFFNNIVNMTKIVDWVPLGMAQRLLFLSTSFAKCWSVVRLARSHCSIFLNLPPSGRRKRRGEKKDTMTACTTMMMSKWRRESTMFGVVTLTNLCLTLSFLFSIVSFLRYVDEFGHDDYDDPDYGYQDDPCT
jgi:hypothetical protein